MKQNRHCLNALCHCCSRKAWTASVQSFTWWQQATLNNRDHEITLVVTISKYYQLFTSFTSIIRGNSPRSVHRDHSIIACLCHINMGVILRTHPVRGESHIQHKANREVATPFWALSCL